MYVCMYVYIVVVATLAPRSLPHFAAPCAMDAPNGAELPSIRGAGCQRITAGAAETGHEDLYTRHSTPNYAVMKVA